MKKKKTQEKEQNLENSIKEIETKEEKTEDLKFLQEKKSRNNFITRKKDGRSSFEVKSKMGC